ncbi:hypothetical protein CC80DRAFT_536878 [Byssothecium circinans]|uniref:VWFA domain-containing protein n=1 Tax=Byssothecium circinans TaxID=147558 RepID=A0A6A5TQ62_9PLEO|nr:hypothetical protein CC80DRAFT_536878 [Byssothecium circinans]
MTEKTCTVFIKNVSDDQSEKHRYFAYFVDQDVVNLVNQKVTGGPLTTRQPVFYRTKHLDATGRSPGQFKISSQLYAVIGERQNYNASRPLRHNDEITLKHFQPIEIGARGDNGSALVVEWDKNDGPYFDDERKERDARMGSFSITCSASFPKDNAYVVGLARSINGSERPVAVVACTRNTEYQFTPREEIYIERCGPANKDSIENGKIVLVTNRKSTLRARLWLRFDSDGGDIRVNEVSRGFLVNGHLTGDAGSTVAEESDQDEASAPQPSRGASTSTSQPPDQGKGQSHPNSDPPVKEPDRAEHREREHPPPPNAGPGKPATDSHTAHPSSSAPNPNQQGPAASASASASAGASATAGQPPRTATPPAEAQNSGRTTEEPGAANDDESDDESPTSFSRLRNYHTVFVVDDTGSMLLPPYGDYTGVRQVPRGYNGPTRWTMVLEALQHIIDVAVRYGGIDIHFLVRSWRGRRNIEESDDARTLLKEIAKDFRGGGGPTKFKPTLQSILQSHVEKLRKSREPRSKIDGPKPLDLIVLTDGVAKDKEATEALIVKTARELSAIDEVRPDQVGIQFVQVGEDKVAAQFLKRLEKDIKSQLDDHRDIVDTMRYDYKPGEVPLKDMLAKIFFGAVDKDFYNQG